MLELFTLRPTAFGLDISDLSLKIAQVKKARKGLKLVSFGETSLPPGVIEKGEIKKKEVLAKLLKQALSRVKGEKISHPYVAASLPEEQAFLQVIQLPRMKKEDVPHAIRFEAENYIPHPLQTLTLDSDPVTPFFNHLDHLDVLLAAFPAALVTSYINLLKEVGLAPQALEIESLATARAIVPKGVAPLPVLILDLGATKTSLIVFSGYSVRFTSSLSISAEQFTDSLVRNLKIGREEAEKLKRDYGVKREENKEVFEALLGPLVDLGEQIKKYLEYYRSHVPHQHLEKEENAIRKVILCGGGANLKGLGDFLTKELKVEVERGNPWVNILPTPLKEIPPLSFEESLKYTTVLGLALRNYDQPSS